MNNRLQLCFIGGPDVDKRIPLLQRLANRYEVSVIGSDAALATRFERSGFRFESYPLSRRFDLRSDFRSVISLRSCIRRLRPQIVHCFDTKPAVVGRLAARLEGVPVVLATLPGLGGLFTYDSARVRRRRWIYQHLHRLACSLSDRTVFQNPDDLNQFCQLNIVSRSRSYMIRGSGVCGTRFHRRSLNPNAGIEKARQLGLDPAAPVVMLVGRLIRSKGIVDLVDAVPLIRARIPEVQFVVAGSPDPEALDPLSRAEMRRLRRRVLWLGERSDVPELLACADILIYPSYYREGVPRVLIEAALLGVPIACADNVGNREVVQHGRTGLCFSARNTHSLADAVLRLLGDPVLRSSVAKVARRHALRSFELSVIADHHRQLYQGLWKERS